MADVLDVLAAIKEAERSTKALMDAFPEWSDREFASKILGNMRNGGLIQKRSNGYWALTRKGRERLDGVSDLGNKSGKEEMASGSDQEQIDEKVTAVSDWEKNIRDTSRKAESDAADPDFSAMTGEVKPERISPWEMARQLQHEIPNGSSLVIEADEIFLAWRGARFAIEQRKDLEAFKAIQEAYIGEVA